MNSLHRKIAVWLFILLFCLTVVGATANVINPCDSRACCCSIRMPMDLHEPSFSDDSIETTCCSSSQNDTCHLNKNRAPGLLAYIASSIMEDLHKIDDYMAIAVETPSKLKPFSEATANTQFWAVTYPIPIYLQNLTLIC